MIILEVFYLLGGFELKKIDKIEDFGRIHDFLRDNIIYKFCQTTDDNMQYIEIDSIKPDKLLINKLLVNQELIFIIVHRFIECRRMLLDQDYKKISVYNIESKKGEAQIVFNYSKCNITLCSSMEDGNTLMPTDRDFLMELLNLIDNGCDPVIMSKEDQQFYLILGPGLTIKFDRKLLKYIEEFAVNCKHNKNSISKLERRIINEK